MCLGFEYRDYHAVAQYRRVVAQVPFRRLEVVPRVALVHAHAILVLIRFLFPVQVFLLR
jgi:hypothetical protein